MQYLKATKTLSITFDGKERGYLIIKSYSDPDWASDNATKKLISRFIFMLNGKSVN